MSGEQKIKAILGVLFALVTGVVIGTLLPDFPSVPPSAPLTEAKP